ncbi:hypothetical protein U9M48_021363 [Paspalum notatum var. saurae]|uniref:Retrovirus-related Pol polyprotein from transposon TNT 1-94 n=1 Tax=Paspalum notatum var. saurae TaxID=547442 RepID=A0AAQ3WSM6_PASNO
MKYDIPLLDYDTRFSLWQVKMRAILSQADLDDALDKFGNKDSKDTILYSRDTLTLNDVCEALQAKKKMKQMMSSDGSASNGEALAARGRTKKKSNNGSKVKSGGSVGMDDDIPCQIIGIGSVQIKMHDGIVRTLTDVRHIPDMTKNLISLSTLDGKGYKYSGGDGVLKVSKGSLIVMKADLKSANLYRLRGTTITGYKLWNPQTQKVVLSRNVIFNETAMLSDNLSSDAPVEGQQKSSVQVEYFIDVDNTPENDNDAVQDAHIPHNSPIVDDSFFVEHSSPVVQPPQHSIAVDRAVRARKPVRRLIEECNIAYALSVAEEIEGNAEPSNYSEAITSADCNNLVTTMQDEMESLEKNGVIAEGGIKLA